MKTNTSIVLGLIAIIGLVLLGRMALQQPAPPEKARIVTERVTAPEPSGDPTTPVVTPPPASDPLPAEPVAIIPETAAPPPKANAAAAPVIAPQSKPAKKPKPPLQDPDARLAMSLVGVDPEAEAYWLEAIFDASLPDREREDLIEDLNEEGLSDRKQPSLEDLQLILNRLAILEEIAPEADEFMLRHIQEAYKDLLNLADITLGEGKPVR